MDTRRLLSATALLALAASGASAQQLQPGLWEMSSKMTSSNGEMERAMAQAQAQMAAMPPEQRKMIEDMMAKQGVGMAPGGAAGNTVRLCLSKEMVERDAVPAQQSGDCKTTTSPRVGNTMKVSFVCTKPPSSGDGTVTFLGPNSYASKMNVRTTQGGKAETLSIDSTSKWLSADCGALKPVGAPPAPAKK